MKKTFFIATLLAALMLCGCNDNNDPKEEILVRPGGIIDRIFTRPNPNPLHLTPSSNQLAYAQMGADFAQSLFNKLCAEAKPGENVCISPLSLEIALGMLANGVEGEACTEMLDIIAGKGVTTDSLNAWYYKLRSALEATNCVRLANAMWAQTGYFINPDFIAVNQTYYDAEVGNLDFAKTQEAADSIGQWAYDHTYGNIRDLDLPIDASTLFVLANATWFGANWAEPFNTLLTKKATFTCSDGTKQTVDMMTKGGNYLYEERPNYQIVDLPFGVFEEAKYAHGQYECIDTPYSMVIALPKEGCPVNDILADIDWDIKRHEDGIVHLPKFNFKTSNSLIQPLMKLGIQKLFQEGALDGIHAGLAISLIKQDVSVKIDEEGAEMAAVTIVTLYESDIGDGNEPTPFDFNANRPFVFAVRDNVSHNLLFIGKVESIEDI